jgi:hypothetical protein
MSLRGGRLALWSAGVALVLPVLLGLGWLGAPREDHPLVDATEEVAENGTSFRATTDSLAQRARGLAPFRADGRPASIPYDPIRAASPDPSHGAPKPGLSLTGVVGGTAPMAVLEGVPGREGPILLGVGDTIAGLKIRRIKEGFVTVSGMDTTWVLTVRRMP